MLLTVSQVQLMEADALGCVLWAGIPPAGLTRRQALHRICARARVCGGLAGSSEVLPPPVCSVGAAGGLGEVGEPCGRWGLAGGPCSGRGRWWGPPEGLWLQEEQVVAGQLESGRFSRGRGLWKGPRQPGRFRAVVKGKLTGFLKRPGPGRVRAGYTQGAEGPRPGAELSVGIVVCACFELRN